MPLAPAPLIRPTEAEDLPALKRVITEIGLFPPDMLAPMFNDMSSAVWLTVLEQGTAIGLCVLRPEEMADDVWNMLALAIRPDFHRRGLARRLIAVAETTVAGKGARMMIVDTSSGEAFRGARTLYAATGYEEEARIREYWGPGDAKVMFRKVLAG